MGFSLDKKMRYFDKSRFSSLRESEKRFIVLFFLSLVIIIGMGIYDLITDSYTGGVLQSRFGTTSTTISYGSTGLFEIAGILILIFIICVLVPAKDKKVPEEVPQKIKRRSSRKSKALDKQE